MSKTLLYLFFLLNWKQLLGQRAVFFENFEDRAESKIRYFGLDTYKPDQKYDITILSNSKRFPYREYYASFPCDDTTESNFYTNIIVYDRDIYNWRQFLVIPLDTVLTAQKNYQISMDVKLEACSSFSIDSLGFYIFDNYTQILNFFRNGFNEGANESNLSLKQIDIISWITLKSIINLQSEGQFLVIGNFRFENQQKLIGKKRCCEDGNKHGTKKQSSIFIDNIKIYDLAK